MIELHEFIVVNRPVEEVFRYVSNFRNIEAWDPGVVGSEKMSPGPVQVGTRFRLALRYGLAGFGMTYVIEAYEAPARVVLRGEGRTFSAVDTILFSRKGGATRIDYRVRLSFTGVKAHCEAMLRPVMNRVAAKAMGGLRRVLASPGRYRREDSAFPSGTGFWDYWADRAILPGMAGFTRWGHAFSRRFWRPNPASLKGKTAVVTGATSGIGKAAAFGLAERDATLVLVGRDREKLETTRRELVVQTGNEEILYYVADLGLMERVKLLAQVISRDLKGVDILVNNAGALFSERRETGEGVERSFATNLLGVYFLTEQLLGPLSESRQPRIVNVASGGMYTRRLEVDDLESRGLPYNGAGAYALAKRGVVILSEYWAQALAAKGFHVHAMHPGWVDTPGLARSLPRFYRLMKPALRSPVQGADTVVWLASAWEPGLCSGRFWLDRRPHETHVFKGTRESGKERERLLEILNARVCPWR